MILMIHQLIVVFCHTLQEKSVDLLIVESGEGKTIALLPLYLQTTTGVGWEGEKNLGK